MFGSYGSGKSLVAFEMGFCVAANIEWYNNKVLQGSVVIIAGEGHSGISQRFAALSIKYGIDCPDNIHLSEIPTDFTNPEMAKEVHDEVNARCADATLVIIDTLNRNFGSGDENSTSDMTKFVNNIDKLFRHTNKTVLIIHHTAKNNHDNSRGSSVLPSACEGEFIVKKVGETGLQLYGNKQRNDKLLDPMFYNINEIELPNFTFDDEKASSVFLEINAETSIKKNHKLQLTEEEEKAMEAFSKIYTDSPQEIPTEIQKNYSIDKKHKVVFVSDWQKEACKRFTVDCKNPTEINIKNAKRAKFNRVRKKLYEKNRIVTHNEYAWNYDYNKSAPNMENRNH